jgi:hypothetical protein
MPRDPVLLNPSVGGCGYLPDFSLWPDFFSRLCPIGDSIGNKIRRKNELWGLSTLWLNILKGL